MAVENRASTPYVLVVDDDSLIRNGVADFLELEGYRTVRSANGREAVRAIENSLPALVLLDMRMPELDGWGVARELGKRGIVVPIAVMTAASDAEAWAREIHADAFLAKPFHIEDLLAIVQRYWTSAEPTVS